MTDETIHFEILSRYLGVTRRAIEKRARAGAYGPIPYAARVSRSEFETRHGLIEQTKLHLAAEAYWAEKRARLANKNLRPRGDGHSKKVATGERAK